VGSSCDHVCLALLAWWTVGERMVELMPTFSNKLTAAQIERLAILSEEMGEAQQIIGKILRHGYASYHPANAMDSNVMLLIRELGDVAFAMDLMDRAKDISMTSVWNRADDKRQAIKPFLHHQPKRLL
jgi:hypothetical protein